MDASTSELCEFYFQGEYVEWLWKQVQVARLHKKPILAAHLGTLSRGHRHCSMQIQLLFDAPTIIECIWTV